MTTRRQFLARGAMAGVALGMAAPRWCLAQPSAMDNHLMIDDRTSAAVSAGLDFLAGRQQDDGSLGGTGYRANVGVCSLAGMAMMAAGSTPGRGPHGRQVDRFLSYVLENTLESGFISYGPASSHGPMYGHGFSAMFLAECYGMSPRSDLREKLAAAVKLIVNSQNDEGGWRYQPQRDDADISVTVCQVMALRAARNAGIYVPSETIDACVEYILSCQNADGGFMYMKEGSQSAFPRSAAAVVALYSAGIYDGPELEKGLEYLMGFVPHPDVPSRHSHYFYAHYYAVQAMWHAGGDYWRQWYPAIRDELLHQTGSDRYRQHDDGSWSDPIGREYATAMACLILQMPNNYLPIFQR